VNFLKSGSLLNKKWEDKILLVLVVVPFLLLFLLTTGPFLYSLLMSFFDFILYHSKVNFVGIKNYIDMFTSAEFRYSLFLTFYQVGVSIILQLIISMIIALLLSRRDLFMSRINKTVFLIPMMVTPVVVAITWKMLFNADVGMINYLLGFLNIHHLNWLGSYQLAMPAIIIVDLWYSTPFMVVILLAGLESLPKEPFEAAIVDGANGLQTFFRITLPLLKPTVLVALLFRIMDAFRRFESIFIMTNGGPGRATEVLNLHIYFKAFQDQNMGYASTLSVTMIGIMLIISLVIIRYFDKNPEGES
jgi:multiple sugar transport system permease protein